MKQAILLTLATVAVLEAGFVLAGYVTVATIAFGAVAIMAVLIALTFFWLWAVHATPLALGMVLSWLGVGGLAAWRWAFNVFDAPGWTTANPVILALLALTMSGSLLHFAVIQRSFGFRGLEFLWPVVGALGCSVLAHVWLGQ
ncbi:hypothetical protein [Maritimibacter sp. DP1N21-5]|uniref:hypothetical protein n=1 Tax=Maritimibacter sp. DP1N21-5 TaxID=2836867 RepID=UPI001C44DBCC|nr:hypothetical protein [Maritimibacter sp. DP1N21-5]MBV7409568.1 hypothetical protein [Maritimibacter sp. DP1N21-5]